MMAIPDFTENDIRRFWEFVEKGDGCWMWKGRPAAPGGYGRFGFRKQYYPAHRCMWKLIHGEPGELWVLHHCDNPICVRPEHLFLGTPMDNTRDAISKGRHVRWTAAHAMRKVKNWGRPGERHHGAKLTERQVLEIRRRHAAGESVMSMAGDFDVNWRSLYDVVNRVTWKHIKPQPPATVYDNWKI